MLATFYFLGLLMFLLIFSSRTMLIGLQVIKHVLMKKTRFFLLTRQQGIAGSISRMDIMGMINIRFLFSKNQHSGLRKQTRQLT